MIVFWFGNFESGSLTKKNFRVYYYYFLGTSQANPRRRGRVGKGRGWVGLQGKQDELHNWEVSVMIFVFVGGLGGGCRWQFCDSFALKTFCFKSIDHSKRLFFAKKSGASRA